MTPAPRVMLSMAAAALAALLPLEARACSTCACGDPTLTAMGAEQPYAGRVRVALEGRFHTDGAQSADPSVTHAQREYRMGLTVSWAALDWLVVSGAAPFMVRDVSAQGGPTRSLGLGSAELRFRAVVLRDRRFQPRHLLAINAGGALPIGQGGGHDPHSGGLGEAAAGLSYSAFFNGPFSLYASATGMLPVGGVPLGAGRALHATLMGQAQLLPSLALRVGADGRYQAELVTHGVLQPHSASAVTFASADLLFSPRTDLTLVAGLKIPVHARLQPDRWEGVFASLAVIFDLEAR